MVGGFKRCAGVLLDQQDRDAKLAQSHHDTEDFTHNQRREAKAWLVEQQEARLGHQRAAERQHLTLAAGQRAGKLIASFGKTRKACVDILQIALYGGTVAPARISAEDKVVLDRHLGEQLAPLRHEADAAPHALLCAERADIDLFVAAHAFRRQQAHQRGEQGGFARAVRADHGDDLSGLHLEADAGYGFDLAIADVQIVDREQRGHATPPR